MKIPGFAFFFKVNKNKLMSWSEVQEISLFYTTINKEKKPNLCSV